MKPQELENEIVTEKHKNIVDIGLEDERALKERVTCFGTQLGKRDIFYPYVIALNLPKPERNELNQEDFLSEEKMETMIGRTDVVKFIKILEQSAGSRIAALEDDELNNIFTFQQPECTKRIGPLTAKDAFMIFDAMDILQGYRALQSKLFSAIEHAMKCESMKKLASACLIRTAMQLMLQKLDQDLAALRPTSGFEVYDKRLKDLQNLKHAYRAGLTGTFNAEDILKKPDVSVKTEEDQIDQPDSVFKAREKDGETDPSQLNLNFGLSANRNIVDYDHFAGEKDESESGKYLINFPCSSDEYSSGDDLSVDPKASGKKLSNITSKKSGGKDFHETRKIPDRIHSDSSGGSEPYVWKNSDEDSPKRKSYPRKPKSRTCKAPDPIEIGKNVNTDLKPKNGFRKKSMAPRPRDEGIQEFRNLILGKSNNSFQHHKLDAALLWAHEGLPRQSRDRADSDFQDSDKEWSSEPESLRDTEEDTYITGHASADLAEEGDKTSVGEPSICESQDSNIPEILSSVDDTSRTRAAVSEASQTEGYLPSECRSDTAVEVDGHDEDLMWESLELANDSQVSSLDDMIPSQTSLRGQPLAVASSDTPGHPSHYQEWIPLQPQSPVESNILESNSYIAFQHYNAAGGSSYSLGHILSHPQDEPGPGAEQLCPATSDHLGATGFTPDASSSQHQSFPGALPTGTTGPDVIQPRHETSCDGSTPVRLPPITVHVAGSLPPWATKTAKIDLSRAASRRFTPMNERRATYDDDWPSDDSGIDAANMALAGFYRSGPGRRVRCFYCGLELDHLAAGDNVWDEHVRYRPTCPYLLAIMGEDMVLQTHINLNKKP